MSNWIYFCLFAINICKTHYPFDISVRIAQTLFSEKCLPSLLSSCNYLLGRRPSQPFRDIINSKQFITSFCCRCCYIQLSFEGRRETMPIWATERYRLVRKNIVIEKQVAVWSDSLLFCQLCGHCLAPVVVRELYCLGSDPVSVIFKLCGLGETA